MSNEILFTNQYAVLISGTIFYTNWLVFKAILKHIEHPDGITTCLYSKKIKMFYSPGIS
jgi:hypothetical protein